MAGIDWSMFQQLAGGNRGQGVMPTLPSIQSQPVQLPVLSVIFVDGREGADAYPLPPSCQGVPLFDKNTGALYIKSTDAYNNPKVVEYEPPIVKRTEEDKQKEMMVAMDERMSRMEAMMAQFMNGGGNNGNEPNNGSFKQGKHNGRGSGGPNQSPDNNT